MVPADIPGECQGLDLEYHMGVQRMRSDGAAKLLEAVGQWHGKLQSIYLVGQLISDEGAAALAAYLKSDAGSHVVDIVLMRNDIGDEGAKALAEAVATHPTLQKLNLVRNNIGSDGATALAAALTTNTVLKELLLNYNKIGAPGVEALGDAIAKNEVLVRIQLHMNECEDKAVL